MFDILQYLPCPWGVVALRGIQNQGFDFFEVANQGCNFLVFLYIFGKMLKCRLTINIFTGFKVPPELCDWWWPASGGSATSEKTRPWIFGACILWILSIFVDFIENGTSFTEKCVKFTKLCSKISFCVFARGSRWSRWSHRSGGMKCCWDPPSTRAGGQDDVSFTNSLK